MFGAVGTILGGIGALGGLSALYVGPIIAFFASPVGRALLVYVILPAMIFAYGFYKGDQHGDRQCMDARQEATLARARLESNLAKGQAATAKRVATELEYEHAKAMERISELQDQLKTKPTVVYTSDCRVPGGVRPRPAGKQ